MARRPRILFEGAIYHITFRGNFDQEIFTDTADRRRMLDRLSSTAEAHDVRLYLYGLMPNHVHLLVETPRANLDRFMGSLLTAYSVYFNRKHDRYGHVFQGRYGAQLVSGDRYLLNLSRYIHLNPVRTDYWEHQPLAEKIAFLRQFGWSSYRSYIGLAPELEGLDSAPVFGLLNAPKSTDSHEAYRAFVEAGLVDGDEGFGDLVEKHPVALGPESFIQEMNEQAQAIATGKTTSTGTGFRRVSTPRPAAEVIDAVTEVVGAGSEIFQKRVHGAEARAVLALALQRYAGLSQADIAEHLGLNTGAAISSMIHRYRDHDAVRDHLHQLQHILKE